MRKQKLKKEGLAIEYSKMGVRVIGLRYFNVFGKGQSKEYAGVLKLFFRNGSGINYHQRLMVMENNSEILYMLVTW